MKENMKTGDTKSCLEELRRQITAAYDNKQWDQLKNLCEIVLYEYPDEVSGEDHFHYSRVFFESRDYTESVEYLKKALNALDRNKSGYAWYNMGIAYGESGDHEKAKECFQKALDLPVQNILGDVWHSMGVANYEIGNYDEAIECFQKALQIPDIKNPGDVWYDMGEVYQDKGEYDKALECYQKALDSPDFDEHGDAWYNMGLVLWEVGDDVSLGKAEDLFRKAAEWYRDAGEPENAFDADDQARQIFMELSDGK